MADDGFPNYAMSMQILASLNRYQIVDESSLRVIVETGNRRITVVGDFQYHRQKQLMHNCKWTDYYSFGSLSDDQARNQWAVYCWTPENRIITFTIRNGFENQCVFNSPIDSDIPKSRNTFRYHHLLLPFERMFQWTLNPYIGWYFY